MKEVAASNRLVYKKDVKLLTVGDIDKFYDYAKMNPNMTWFGVVWCTTEWQISDSISFPC